MSAEEVKTCSRAGCGKTLRSTNTQGVCGSGCLSDEAPPSMRAGGSAGGRSKAAKVDAPPAAPGALGRFRVVAEALGKDPDALLEAFAESWLGALRERVED